jgi:hypothetical protein
MKYRESNPQVVENMATFMGVKLDKYLPHHVTENDYLERLNPNELQDTILVIVYNLIWQLFFSYSTSWQSKKGAYAS